MYWPIDEKRPDIKITDSNENDLVINVKPRSIEWVDLHYSYMMV